MNSLKVTTTLLHIIGNGSKAQNVQKCRKCFMPVCSENCGNVHQNNRYDTFIDSLISQNNRSMIQIYNH